MENLIENLLGVALLFGPFVIFFVGFALGINQAEKDMRNRLREPLEYLRDGIKGNNNALASDALEWTEDRLARKRSRFDRVGYY